MAWLETDRHGRLRIGFKYYNGESYRDVATPLVIESVIGDKKVAELAPEDVDLWRSWINDRRKATGEALSPRRKNMALDVLSQVIQLARERQHIKEDILLGVRPFKH